MKKLRVLCLCLPLIATSVFGRGLNLWFEPMWVGSGRDLHRPFLDGTSSDDRTILGFGGNISWMPTPNIAIGPTAFLMFSNLRERDKSHRGIADTILNSELIVSIPLALTVTIDPIPQFRIHPVGHISLGYNSVFISNNDYSEKITQRPPEDAGVEREPDEPVINIMDRNGYYSGVFIRFGADVMIDIGKQFSLFAGPQWQISPVMRRGKEVKTELNFNMFGFRFGASILL